MAEMICTNHPQSDGSIVRCARCLRPFCSDCLVRISGTPYCGDCKQERLMDVASGAAQATLPLASIGQRWGALIIDRLIIVVPLIVAFFLNFIGGPQHEFENPLLVILLVILAIAAFLYEPLMTARGGQTLGKRAVSIRIVRPDGSNISTGQAWGRYGTRIAISMISGLIDIIPALVTAEKTALHDLVASTRVVRVD